MPEALARVLQALHDELSQRTLGELPADVLPVKLTKRPTIVQQGCGIQTKLAAR